MLKKVKKSFYYNFALLVFGPLLLIKLSPSYLVVFAILALIILPVLYKSVFKLLLYLSLAISSLITVLIILSLFAETFSFFKLIWPWDFFLGQKWQPYYTLSESQVKKLFGILPLLNGTILIALISIIIGAPIGTFVAVFITYFASRKWRGTIKPLIEVMAGIPTVVYGYFALNTIVPLMLRFGEAINIHIAPESALTAGIVIGIMIIPLISSLVDDIFHGVPKSLYYGAAALGSTQSEIILKVIFPFALPGIMSVILLAFSRALGETMIVLMLTGVSAELDFNPLHSFTTITVQIATMLSGDQTFNSAESLSAYALGFTLFAITWILNAVAIRVVQNYKNNY